MTIKVVLSVSRHGILYIYRPGARLEVRTTFDYAGAYDLRARLLAEYAQEQAAQAAQPELLAA